MGDATSIPPDFLCAITQELMQDPVTTIDGETYERAAIQEWFNGGRATSPRTNQPLGTTVLTPNTTLRRAIQDFVEQRLPQAREAWERQHTEVDRLRASVAARERQLEALAAKSRDAVPMSQIQGILDENEKLRKEIASLRAQQSERTSAVVEGDGGSTRGRSRVPVSSSTASSGAPGTLRLPPAPAQDQRGEAARRALGEVQSDFESCDEAHKLAQSRLIESKEKVASAQAGLAACENQCEQQAADVLSKQAAEQASSTDLVNFLVDEGFVESEEEARALVRSLQEGSREAKGAKQRHYVEVVKAMGKAQAASEAAKEGAERAREALEAAKDVQKKATATELDASQKVQDAKARLDEAEGEVRSASALESSGEEARRWAWELSEGAYHATDARSRALVALVKGVTKQLEASFEQKLGGIRADVSALADAQARPKAEAIALLNGDCSASEIRAKGYTARDIRFLAIEAGRNLSASECKARGFLAVECKQAGYSAFEFLKAGYSDSEFKGAGYTVLEYTEAVEPDEDEVDVTYKTPKEAGYSASECKEAGYSASWCEWHRYSASECKEAGYSAAECQNARYSASKCREAGFSVAECKEAFTHNECVAAFTSSELTSAGFDDTLELPCTLSGHHSSVHSVHASADNQYLFTGSYDKTARMWRVSDGSCVKTFSGHSDNVSSVHASADNQYLFTGSYDKTARMWRVSDGSCVKTFEGHSDYVNSVHASANGQHLFTGSGSNCSRSIDNTLRMWRVSDGSCVKIFSGHRFSVRSVHASADNQYLFTGSWDKTARMWRVSDGSCVKTFSGHSHYVNSVHASADNQYLFTGSYDKTARMWRVSDGSCVKTFSGHSRIVESVHASADNQYLLTGSWDKTARMWRVSDGSCVKTFSGHSDYVYSVHASADNQYLFTGSGDHTARMWSM